MFMIGSAVPEGRAAPPKPRSQPDPEVLLSAYQQNLLNYHVV
jgi:hypothetical protein